MLRAVAAAAFAASFALAGSCFASFQAKKVVAFRDVLLLISELKTRLGYDRPPVSDLIGILSENPGLYRLTFIRSCRERVRSGAPFPKAWREGLEEEKEFCRLLSPRSSELAALGEGLGATDLESQLRKLEYYERIFSEELEVQKEKNRKYAKLFPPLGLLLGVCAAILIV